MSGMAVAQNSDTTKQKSEESKAYIIAASDPQPPRGLELYNAYITENIKYSDKAREARITGKVFVKFLVNIDGSLENLEVLKGIDPDLDQEAIRVIKDGPKWKPARENGKLVRRQRVFIVRFNLP